MDTDHTGPMTEAPETPAALGETRTTAEDGDEGLGIELISISELESPCSANGSAQLLDIVGCEIGPEIPGKGISADDAQEPNPSDTDDHPPRWTGIATGADVVTPEDVRHDSARFHQAGRLDAQDSVNFRLNELSVQMNDLLRQFEEKLKYDAHKEKVIDVLHSELQEYKTDLIKKYVTGLVMDLIKVVDDARKMAAHFKGKELSPEDSPKLIKALEDVAQDMEDVFQVQGVTPFVAEDPRFDPVRQRVVRKVETGLAEMDKTIAESLAPGYEWDGKVIRREHVAVYSHNPALGA